MRRFHRQALSRAHLTRFLAAIRTRKERLVCTVLLHTGMRVSEFARLRYEDLDLSVMEDDVGFHSRDMARVLGKGRGRKKPREVPLSPEACRLLVEWLGEHGGLCIAYRTAQQIVRRVGRRAGLETPVSPHILRHTFAVEYLRRGGTLAALRRLLGHEYAATTAIYLEMAPEDAFQEFRDKRGWYGGEQKDESRASGL